MSDPINPSHYDGTAALEAMVAKHGLLAAIGFCECNVDKYRYRAGRKPGVPAEQDEAKARQYEVFAAELRGRLPQGLLTGERLQAIRDLSQQERATPKGTSKHTYGLAPKVAATVPELLAHADALQVFYTTRDNQLCEAHESFVRQVEKEMAELVATHQDDPLLSEAVNKLLQMSRSLIRGAAIRLNISL